MGESLELAYHEMVGSGLLSTSQSRLRGSLPSTSVVAVALIVTFGTTEKATSQNGKIEAEHRKSRNFVREFLSTSPLQWTSTATARGADDPREFEAMQE